MEPVALRARLGHLLEPDRGALPSRIDDRVSRARPAWLVGVAEYRPPEWPDRGGVKGVDRYLQDLHRPAPATGRAWAGAQAKPGHHGRDLDRQLGVCRGDPV